MKYTELLVRQTCLLLDDKERVNIISVIELCDEICAKAKNDDYLSDLCRDIANHLDELLNYHNEIQQ